MKNRNVVVICLDTVRKDRFDRHAKRIQQRSDISIGQCRSASSWTVPSHASLFTGRLPHQHGVHADNTDFSSLSREHTFLDNLHGYQTLCVSANPYLDSSFGIDALFDEVSDITGSVRYPEGMYLRDFTSERDDLLQYRDYLRQALRHEHPLKSLANGIQYGLSLLKPSFAPRFGDDGGKAVVEETTRQVSNIDEPYFAFINFMEAHGPFSPSRRYDPSLHSAPTSWTSHELDFWEVNADGLDETHEPDLTYYRELYAASIDYLDRLVAELIDRLEGESSRETTFIVTSDHGENLGYAADEHLLEHKGSLTEGLLHVPFTVVNPPQNQESRNIQGYFSHLDLGDLVIDITRDKFEPRMRDQIPAELVGLGANDPPLDDREYQYWNRMIRCVYEENTKITWDSLGNAFEVRLDPTTACSRRQTTRIDEPPSWVEKFFTETAESYKERIATRNTTTEVNESTQDRLEDLGYL